MVYTLLKFILYMISLVCVIYGLSCIPFEKMIKKNHVRQFYVLYIIVVLSLTYLVAHFFLDFMTIRLG